jgi:hypothetical protein
MERVAFRPGENVHVPPQLAAIGSGSSGGGAPSCVVVRVPSRVGLCVRDMTTFGPGKAGGGGIGLSLNLFSTTWGLVVPRCAPIASPVSADSDDGVVVVSKRKAVLQHHVAVFRACLTAAGAGARAQFAATIVNEEKWSSHSGLGSTSAAVLGVYHVLNEALGQPFSRESLRHILACNYVEEDPKGAPGLIAFG